MGDSTESLSKNEAEAMAELEAEFQRELERNAMAVRLLQQKAEEAKQAKQRYNKWSFDPQKKAFPFYTKM